MEDLFYDIIAKSQAGLSMGNQKLSDMTGISVATIRHIKQGHIDSTALLKIAKALGLHGESLLDLANEACKPKAVELEGLNCFTTDYWDFTVNAYLVVCEKTRAAAIFDTGTDVSGITTIIEGGNYQVGGIFLTHTHSDHIAELGTLQKLFPKAETYVHENEAIANAVSIREGRVFNIGALEISTRKTSGHSPGGLTYIVKGLGSTIAIVGDALFSGSMGGAASAYKEALQNNIEQIFTLDDATILCPGHGPMTTVGEEKKHNPFFPQFK